MGLHFFDPGYGIEPFRTLCEQYPDQTAYPARRFRTEWGPVFHRGRLNGSARILVIGQDPGRKDNIVQRILTGEDGRRVQGFLAKLGIDQSYVMINAFLFSVYGSIGSKEVHHPEIERYRNRWLNALLVGSAVEAVVALGPLAEEAWKGWKQTPDGRAIDLPCERIIHPSQPDILAGNNRKKLQEATMKMLANWNTILWKLQPAILHPDDLRPLEPYGEEFKETELVPVPAFDLPAGLPKWMRVHDGWVKRGDRKEKNTGAQRAKMVLTVPKSSRTW